MTTNYPVSVEVTSPPRFDRIQLLLRFALGIGLGWLGVTAGWLVCALFLVLPVIAAISISSGGGERYPAEVAPRVERALTWLLQLSAYMMLLVDRFPAGEDAPVRISYRYTGRPTTGSALLRLLTSIPSGVVLCFLWFVSGVLFVVSAVTVLFAESVPGSILAFQRGVLRWQARLVAYHASFVEEYPPFAFDTETTSGGTFAASRVS